MSRLDNAVGSGHSSQWRSDSWAAGVFLVAFGALWILHNAGAITVGHAFWAILVFLAAVVAAAFGVVRWSTGEADEQRAAAGFALAAVLLALVAGVLWFDLNWSTWWPIFVVVPGIGLLLPRRRTARARADDNQLD